MLTPAPTAGATGWFTAARFGMFIHWGLYSLLARHEWVQSRERIPPERYAEYLTRFNPDRYDPAAWASMAYAAGMRYVVLTAKHHEGFCLWDSAHTDYKVTKTPHGHDLLAPFVAAFRAAGLRVGLYYSLIDWHHPDFPIDGIHPLRDHPDVATLNQKRTGAAYRAYMQAQVRELLTQFGPIDLIWYDFSYPDHRYGNLIGKGRDSWGSAELLALTRTLQPQIIVNNRLDLPTDQADVHTPEQHTPRSWLHIDDQPVVWEACHTFSGAWGYHRDEQSWKSPEQLIALLIDSVAAGGNLLMNVGPTARGTFDARAQAALSTYASWMQLHDRAIYGCTQSAFSPPSGCRYTQSGTRLYLHIFQWPVRFLTLPGLQGRVRYAQLLHDASEVTVLAADGADPHNHTRPATTDLTIELPIRKPDVIVPVVELFLDG